MNSEFHQAFLNTSFRVLQSPFIAIKINQLNAELKCRGLVFVSLVYINPLFTDGLHGK